jgi:hypothetical protein
MMHPVDENSLTEKERELIDKRRITSARNAEKARLKRMEKKQQIKEIEQYEYEKKREDFNSKLDNFVKPAPKVEKKVREVIEDSDSEEEFVIYRPGNKKKLIDEVNEELKREINSMKNEIQTLKKPEPVVQPPPPPVQPQVVTKIIQQVKPPNAEFTHHLKQKILNF